MQLRDLMSHLEAFAPLALAESWDNVGLLLGDPEQPVGRVMTCLTVTPTTVAEAVARQADCIVSHHPILFKAVQRLTTTEPAGRLLLPLLRKGVAVYSPHTAFDNCAGGINDLLAERLGLVEVRPLKALPAAPQVKLVVFVPETHLGQVSAALFAAGAGRLGNYEQCSFRLGGTGTFFGAAGANPVVGQAGQREEVGEWRLEVLVPAGRVRTAVAALRQAHPYEEPAFDLYPLQPTEGPHGIGRRGQLPSPVPLGELARQLAPRLAADVIQFIGAAAKLVATVGIVCGAGGSLLAEAQAANVDAVLTGELRFHDQLAAEERGLGVLLAGHYATERPGVEMLASRLAAAFPALEVWPSQHEHEPTRVAR